MNNSSFSLPDSVEDSSRDFGEVVRPEGLEKAVGYSDGFEQAVGRYSLLVTAGFVGLTANLIGASLVEREKKIPLIPDSLNEKILPGIREFGFWLGYGSVSVMFFIHTLGYGMVIQEVR